MVSERWPTRVNLTRTGCPVLLIHGDKDEVIPFRHSAKLRKDAAKRSTAHAARNFGDRNDTKQGDGHFRHGTKGGAAGVVQLHVQKGASHNVFDFYGDVADPIASFLERHERAPFAKGGASLDEMGLDLQNLDTRLAEVGPGEAEEYPFANG